MRIAGNYTFEATREELWSALTDPVVLSRAIAGCQRLDKIAENEYESTLKIGLPAVRGVYSGRVKITTQVPPESYTIQVDGKGSNGSLRGDGVIKLRTDGASTILDYGGEAHIGGMIASVGQRLLDTAAKTLINQSLRALAAQLEQQRRPVVQPSAETWLQEAPAVSPEAAARQAAPSRLTPTLPFTPPDSLPLRNGTAPPITPRSGITIERVVTPPPTQKPTQLQLARSAVERFFHERPWAPWVVTAFLVGYLFGRR